MHPPSVPDCYAVLGVPRTASSAQIKKAYHILSIKHHPDKNGGDGVMMTKINEANQILGVPGSRSVYDLDYANIKRAWTKYHAWVAKGGFNAPKSKAKAKFKTKAKTKAKPKTQTKTKAAPKSKAKKAAQKKLKSDVPIKRESEAEDIGPQYKVDMGDGNEITMEEHERDCGCELCDATEENPIVSDDDEQYGDDDYTDEDASVSEDSDEESLDDGDMDLD